jgi:hemolysin activation/secretion protein
MSKKRRIWPTQVIGLFLAVGLVAWSAPSRAVTPTPSPTSSQELKPAERTPEAEKPSGNRDLLSAPEPGPCPLSNSSLKFKLNDVTFKGADTVPNDELAGTYAGLIGQEVPVSVLCEIRDRASTLLFNRGLFARVEIPAQTIADGHVEFDVIEAYIASVRVTGDDSGAQSKVEDYIERLRGMKPFNIGLAQRYLFLASDVPGVSIAATLRPAGKGRGAIELVIAVTRKPFEIIGNVQNFGSKETGPFGALVRVDGNGFTPLGERSTFVAYTTFDTREQRVFEAMEEGRIGSDGLVATASVSFGETRPGGDLLNAHIYGDSWVVDAGLSYPLIRSRSENLTLSGGFELIEQKISSFKMPLTDDSIRVLSLKAQGDISFRDWPLRLDGNVELRKGISIFGASSKGEPLLSRVQGDPDAFVLRGDARATTNFFVPGLTFSEHIQGQYAGVPLLSYEEQSVGNLTIGRGYDPASVSGDRAVASATDLRWSPFPSSWTVSGSGFAFFDAARVWNLDDKGLNKTVRSVGGGVALDLMQTMHVEVTYAHPMDKINNSLSAVEAPDRVLLSTTVEY